MIVDLVRLLLLVAVSFIVTGLSIRWLRKLRVIDQPNPRSSHVEPTVRGGGAAIAALTVLWWSIDGFESFSVMIVFAAIVVIAFLGLIDDVKGLSVGVRFSVQLLCAFSVAVAMNGLPTIDTGIGVLDFGLVAIPLAIFFIVAFVNIVNFMDGINGITAIEAICVLGFVAINTLNTESVIPSELLFAVVAITLGFLPWNFPAAKVFLGDVGSCFFGLLLAIAMLSAGQVNSTLFWASFVMAGVFVVDGTVTLLRRIVDGQSFSQAHRRHAYQRLARHYDSHTTVTMSVLLINFVWLWPIARAVSTGSLAALPAISIAYLPLVVVVWIAGAGLDGDIGD